MKKICILTLLLLTSYRECMADRDQIVWFPVTPDSSTVVPAPLTITNALEIAYHNRSALHALDHVIKNRKATELEALSGYLPKFSIKSFISQSQKQLSGELSFKKHQQFFNFEQLLYSFAGPLEQYHINRFGTELARLERDLKEDAVQFEVEKNFLTLYSIYKKRASIEALGKAARQQFTYAQAQQRVDLLDAKDWYQEQATYHIAQATVANYTHDQATTLFTLQRSLETELSEPINLSDTQAFIYNSLRAAHAHPLTYYLDTAFAYRKELAIKDQEIEQSKAQVRYYQRSYLPRFSVFATVENGAISIPSSFWLLGIQIAWEFDGLANAFKAEEQKAAVQAAELNKKDTEYSIQLAVQSTYQELQKFTEQLRAAYAEKERARIAFLTKKKQYEIQELSTPDFAAACKEWEDIQFAVTDLETNAALKHRELMYTCGYPQTTPNEIG